MSKHITFKTQDIAESRRQTIEKCLQAIRKQLKMLEAQNVLVHVTKDAIFVQDVKQTIAEMNIEDCSVQV